MVTSMDGSAEVVVPMLAFAHRFLMMLQAISMGEGGKGCALADMAAMAAMADLAIGYWLWASH
jgi:hypothetical protein